MKNRFLAISLFSAIIGVTQIAEAQMKPVIPDKLQHVNPWRISGYIGEKFKASYNNRILTQDVNRLIQPFTKHDEHICWQSEFWGKWFTSAVLAYKYNPTSQLAEILKQAAEGLMATQTLDGYIGNYAPESHLEEWDIWGRKYCMLGLIAYYDLINDKKALDAAAKEADFLMRELKEQHTKIVKMGRFRGMAASSVLEPICQLYVRTGEKKYLDFAEEIVRQWETPDGPQLLSKSGVPVGARFPRPSTDKWYEWEQGQKAYEMMSCYEGLLELYRITGKAQYKNVVEEAWQSISDTEINIAGSGAAMEAWFSGKTFQAYPIAHFQETCVTVTWLKLNQQLLRLTGEAKYADAIETVFYNALLGAMHPDGSDWAKYTPLSGQRLQGSEQCGMGMNCCNASGPRGLFTIPQTILMKSSDGFFLNFFIPGNFAVKTPKGGNVIVNQATDYPISGDVTVTLQLKKKEKFEVAVRIPAWCEHADVAVNGESIPNISTGTYLKINRIWNNNDKIQISFEMQGKVHTIGDKAKYKAITRGPIVLTRDERLTGPRLEAVLTPVEHNGNIKLACKKSNNPDIWMLFTAEFIPESYTEYSAQPMEVELCDYASAGNTPAKYPFFRVWLPQLYNPAN